MSLTLADAIANAYLTAGDAKTDSKGMVRVTVQTDRIQLESYDDYVYLLQVVESQGLYPSSFFIDKKALKEAGEEGFFDLEGTTEGPWITFGNLNDMLTEDLSSQLDKFVFPSDRFGKISRIKGEEPVKLEMCEDAGMKLAKFTKGTGVQGLMAFLEEGDQ